MRHKKIRLKTFLAGSSSPEQRMPGCANLDRSYGGCLFAESCKVMDGFRCEYFEQAVLPTARDIGLYAEMLQQYKDQTGGEYDPVVDSDDQRQCACGQALEKRRRICDKCRRKRRKETYRRNRKKKQGPCATVN